MAEKIIMPKTGMNMKEGIIIKWHVKEGDKVSKGDTVAEIETDKSAMELESDYDGTILRLDFPEGAVVPVVMPIAWVGEPGEKLSESPDPRVRATPAARRLAAEKGIPLDSLRPGGKQGEIRAADVSAGKNVVACFIQENRPGKYVQLTKVQQITGQRMLQSSLEIPSVTADINVDVTTLLEMREEFNKRSGIKISINDCVLFAAARMLKVRPRLNSELVGEEVLFYHEECNIGFAVAAPQGLLVPVIKDADKLSITELAAEATRLGDCCHDGTIKPEQMDCGTFTVSNLGMFGISAFTPIINQPQAAILGVCAVENKLDLIEGEVSLRRVMGLSLTYDHRIIDGAESAMALKTLKEFLEEPQKIDMMK